MKYIVIIAVFLALWCVYQNSRINSLMKENTALETEKKSLIVSVEGAKNAEMEANKTIKQLRDKIRDNNQSNDWYNTPIPVELIDVMQKRHNRHKTD